VHGGRMARCWAPMALANPPRLSQLHLLRRRAWSSHQRFGGIRWRGNRITESADVVKRGIVQVDGRAAIVSLTSRWRKTSHRRVHRKVGRTEMLQTLTRSIPISAPEQRRATCRLHLGWRTADDAWPRR